MPGDIINSLCGQNRGKANGLFVDSLDVFIRPVKREDTETNKAIRLFFKLLNNGKIIECTCPYFTNTHLICFQKDEADPTKLRPMIGVPTEFLQIVTNCVARTFRQGLLAIYCLTTSLLVLIMG